MSLIEVPDDLLISTKKAWSFLVRARAEFQCEECGEGNIVLHAHHLDGDDRNHTLENGQSLCEVCHGRITNFGRKRTAEQRQCLRIARKGQWEQMPQETKERLLEHLRAGRTDPEAIAKRTETKRGVPLADSHRQAISRGLKRAWATGVRT